MRRYSCFSVTGYPVVEDPNPQGRRHYRRRFGDSARGPLTTWYVSDDFDMGRIVFSTPYEHEAREVVFQGLAEERRWQKTREHLIEDLTS